MKILVRRTAKRDTYTIGRLYVDGRYFCNTLEDTDRGLKQSMPIAEIVKKKVYDKTAIPTGEYKIRLDVPSPKYCTKAKTDTFWKPFCNNMPRIESVKGYSGVLIHAGNKDTDTLGCLLVGENTIVGQLTNSRTTFKKLYEILWEGSCHGRVMIDLEIV